MNPLRRPRRAADSVASGRAGRLRVSAARTAGVFTAGAITALGDSGFGRSRCHLPSAP